MLKKLLKYELLFMSKALIIFYIISLVLAGLTRLMVAINFSTFTYIVMQIFSSAFLSISVSTIVNVLMRYWTRFRQNFYADESYLTHTLPIKKSTQYAAKVLGGVITMALTTIFLLGCVLLAYGTPENFEYLKNMFFAVESMLDVPLGVLLSLLGGVFVLEFILLMIIGFFGMVVGHTFQKGKIGFSVLFAAIAYCAGDILLCIVIFIAACFNNDLMQLLINNQTPAASSVILLLVLEIVVTVIALAAIYLLGDRFFKKGVNVD